jgi:hypothetical protein
MAGIGVGREKGVPVKTGGKIQGNCEGPDLSHGCMGWGGSMEEMGVSRSIAAISARWALIIVSPRLLRLEETKGREEGVKDIVENNSGGKRPKEECQPFT